VSFRVKSAQTFVAVVAVSAGVLAGGGAAQADQVWYQGYERTSSTEACTAQPDETPWQASWGPDASWHPSWEMWANGGRGGWTCWRSITWARDPVAPTASTASCGSASGTYSIGDTGPGCGIVFYDAGSVQSWGRYLEAAPNTWYGGAADPTMAWSGNTTDSVVTSTDIGTGATNTTAMIAQNSTAGRAGTAPRAYAGGGLHDWFLPSKDELSQLYIQRAVVGGFASDTYRSSSQGDSGTVAWVEMWTVFNPFLALKSFDVYRVRPVRAF
jgi:hypothetical protein